VAATGLDTIVGVDEAGRGAWLGPLVVAAVAVPFERLTDIRTAGARDSKELSPAAREAVYGRIVRLGRCRSVTIVPRTIDRSVDRGELNLLEARAFARLVRELAPHTAYVDACDADAQRFGRTVAAMAGSAAHVVARHKADRDHPLVGAASIVAKVRRDRAIARLAERLGDEIGSGYPSDARTIDFVRRTVAPGARTPEWLRRSWATTTRVIRVRPGPTLDGFPG
jgi:ribonuclease HII